jgi:hypothetical protein
VQGRRKLELDGQGPVELAGPSQRQFLGTKSRRAQHNFHINKAAGTALKRGRDLARVPDFFAGTSARKLGQDKYQEPSCPRLFSGSAVGLFDVATRRKIEPSLSAVPAGDEVVGTPPHSDNRTLVR